MSAGEDRNIEQMVRVFGMLERGEIEPEPYCDVCGGEKDTKPRRYLGLVVWVCEDCDWIVEKGESDV